LHAFDILDDLWSAIPVYRGSPRLSVNCAWPQLPAQEHSDTFESSFIGTAIGSRSVYVCLAATKAYA
jgi:hypothetical protein